MKVTDARLVLNRRKQGFGRRPPSQQSRFDARMVLESRQSSNNRGGGRPIQRRAFNRPRLPLPQRARETDRVMPGKRVQVRKDGTLWITAKTNQQSVLNRRSQIVPADIGIKITAQNRQRRPFNAGDDDLERMSLEDLSEVRGPSSFLPAPRIAKRRAMAGDQLNTMVADCLDPQGSQVLVSNLPPSVTLQDVLELFSSKGPTRDAKFLRPGTAMVEFFRLQDATTACASFHSRLLDGQPMLCSMNRSASNLSQRLGQVGGSGRVFAASSPPKNKVQFTVKLP